MKANTFTPHRTIYFKLQLKFLQPKNWTNKAPQMSHLNWWESFVHCSPTFTLATERKFFKLLNCRHKSETSNFNFGTITFISLFANLEPFLAQRSWWPILETSLVKPIPHHLHKISQFMLIPIFLLTEYAAKQSNLYMTTPKQD